MIKRLNAALSAAVLQKLAAALPAKSGDRKIGDLPAAPFQGNLEYSFADTPAGDTQVHVVRVLKPASERAQYPTGDDSQAWFRETPDNVVSVTLLASSVDTMLWTDPVTLVPNFTPEETSPFKIWSYEADAEHVITDPVFFAFVIVQFADGDPLIDLCIVNTAR